MRDCVKQHLGKCIYVYVSARRPNHTKIFTQKKTIMAGFMKKNRRILGFLDEKFCVQCSVSRIQMGLRIQIQFLVTLKPYSLLPSAPYHFLHSPAKRPGGANQRGYGIHVHD